MSASDAPKATQPTARRPSLPDLLLRDGSLTAVGIGLGLGSMALGSQDMTGLLDPSLQHMQTAARLDLELLASPRWKALLSWDEGSGSPMHLDTGGSTGTRMPPHCRFDSEPVSASPGVDQQAGDATAWEAWRLAHGPPGGGKALLAEASSQRQPQQPRQQQQRGSGKKRPWAPEGREDEEQQVPAAKAVKREPLEQQVGGKLRPRLASLSSGDRLMLESAAAAAEAAVAEAAAGLDAGFLGPGVGGCRREDSAPADMLERLSHVRLNSVGDTLQHRRLTAAAAAAAVTPAGRLGRVQRSDSNVPMLLAQLPGSPTAGAQRLLSPTADATPLPCQPVPAPPAQPPPATATAPATAPAALASAAEAAAQGPGRQQPASMKSHKAVATGEGGVFTSPYRGVTRHRLTGRFEAHFWDSSFLRPNAKKGGRSRGRQVYLGGYETELEAARAYDRAVLAYIGAQSTLNFPHADYAQDMAWIAGRTPEEVVAILRRGSVGFARGQSQYRGVTRHHQQGKWEARIGKVEGSKYAYLGTFDTAEDAARAYDRACVKFRGSNAILNFDLSNYQGILDDPGSYDILSGTAASAGAATPGASSASLRTARPARAVVGSAPQVYAAAAAAGGFMGAGSASVGSQFLVPPEAAAAAAGAGAAAMAGAAAQGGTNSLFLQLMQPPHPPMGAQQQFGVPPLPQYTSLLQQMAGAIERPSSADPGGSHQPRLPAIRTRAVAAALAAGAPRAAAAAGSGGGTPSSAAPSSGGSRQSLSDFLLSPLAASLLSPLGLSCSPSGWRDSPLGRLAADELGRLLSGANPGGLLSPPRHRLHNSRGAADGEGCAAGSGPARLHSSPTGDIDLLSALQWLDSLDPSQLAALAALECAQPLESGNAGRSSSGDGSGRGGAAPEQQPGGSKA